MIDLKFERKINKPIDEVWKYIVEEFHNSHEWATGTAVCRKGDASEDFDRICETETGTLKDTITKVDHKDHVLEFSVEGLPFFVTSVVSRWRLNELSATETQIILGPKIEVMPVIGTIMQIPMKIAFRKLYPGLMNDLVTFIETGKPSARKQKELEGQA